MKRFWRWMLFLLLLIIGGTAVAAQLTEQNCTIGVEETHVGDLIAVCRELVIDGRVEGRVIAVASTVQVNGTITQDQYLIARDVVLAGTFSDDVHVLAVKLDVLPTVRWSQGDLLFAVVSTTIWGQANLPGNLSAVGYQLVVDGNVGGNLDYFGEMLRISGNVALDAHVRVGDEAYTAASVILPIILGVTVDTPGFQILDQARLAGTLDYVSPVQLDLAEQVRGRVLHTRPYNPPTIEDLVAEQSRTDALRSYFGQVAQQVIALTALGVLLLLIAPWSIHRPVERVSSRPLMNIAVGFVGFILSFPLVILAIAATVVLILLLALLGVDALTLAGGITASLATLTSGSLFYFSAGYLARIVIASALGMFFIRRLTTDAPSIRDWMLSVGVGSLLIALVASLPVIGGVFGLLALSMGLGAILRALRNALRLGSGAASPVRVVMPPKSFMLPPNAPPPIVEDPLTARGLDNLPQGFSWWQDTDIK
jgi:cytoskeletal protein CcmA (bactofilin family)